MGLTVLRPKFAATLGPERFHREIQIAAQLQHPDVLPLLDSGQATDPLFCVTPFVEGPSLSERLARVGALPVPEAARILRDVADALATTWADCRTHSPNEPGWWDPRPSPRPAGGVS